MPTCPLCHRVINPGEPMVSWHAVDVSGNTTQRGAVHLACVANGPLS